MNELAAFPPGAARWPATDAALAFVAALLLAAFGAALLTLVPGAVPDGKLSPVAAQGATLWQDIAFVLVPVALAARFGRPRLRDFGFTPLGPRRLLAWSLGAFIAFVAFSTAWEALIGGGGTQDTLSRLGADESGVLRVTAALLVIVVAPVAEEVLFRGYMYRAMRTSLGPGVAAVAVGVIFGLIHLTDADTAPLVPLLAALGAVMCVLYERTGSLAAPIALHVINNTIAFSFADDVPDAAALGLPIGLGTLAAVVVLAAAGQRQRPGDDHAPPTPRPTAHDTGRPPSSTPVV